MMRGVVVALIFNISLVSLSDLELVSDESEAQNYSARLCGARLPICGRHLVCH